MNARVLRKLIRSSLAEQGFSLTRKGVSFPDPTDKDALRKLHAKAVRHRIDTASSALKRREQELLHRLACGTEIRPERVTPRLVEVRPNSDDELLFRYAKLHWSIPVSAGYGRRLRFLVVDQQNEKLIGLFGLGDPVINLGGRDQWIGWDRRARNHRLRHVMDAFVLGAVPPYSFLLGGKLVAMLVASNEVRAAFKRKYIRRNSLIQETPFDGRLALITTTSALGRSSLYNRIKYQNRPLYLNAGYTQGSGEFHFSNGVYNLIFDYASRRCDPTAKRDEWGSGFRNRREVVKKVLSKLGLPDEWLYHGVRREIFVVPLARNNREFLRGEHSRLQWFDHSAADICEFFRERWLIPRSQRDPSYRSWHPDAWALWNVKPDA